MSQSRLNDLVFVKYNRALKRRFKLRDTIDPIALNDIDESNEWLVGRIDGDSDEDSELVFDDDDALTWGMASRAAGVGESAYNSRSVASGSSSGVSSRVPVRERRSVGGTSSSRVPLELIDEEDETDEEEEEGFEEEETNFDETDFDNLDDDFDEI